MTKISGLPAASSIGGADVLPVVQGGATKKIPASVLSPVQVVQVAVTSAEILDLLANPKVLVAAPAAGSFIQPVSVFLRYNFNTTAYTPGSGAGVQINYDGSAVEIDAAQNISSVITATESVVGMDSFTVPYPGTIPVAEADGKALVLSAQVADFVNGDGTLDITVFYRVVTLP